MSETQHEEPTFGDLADPSRPIVTLRRKLPDGYRFPWQRHMRGQLVYAGKGILRLSTERASWSVPPYQAAWMPGGLLHELRTGGALTLHALYLHGDAIRGLPDAPRVLKVTPLLRELITRIVRLEPNEQLTARGRRLGEVLLDELYAAEPSPLELPLPRGRRLQPILEALHATPGDERGLEEFAPDCRASARTLARVFVRETGMTFGQWRTRLRLNAAVGLLGDGMAVTQVAHTLGYHSPSAFVAMFRRKLGAPPRSYMANAGKGSG